MKKIIIPEKLITAYLDGVTFNFSEDQHRNFERGDKIPSEYYRNSEIMMKRTFESRILELGLLHLQVHPEIPTDEFTNTEMEWSDASIRLVIAEAIAHWFPVHDPKLLDMLPRVELSTIGLNEWRESIRHEIVLEMQRAGISTSWQNGG